MSFEENNNNQSSNIQTNDASSENTTENVGSAIENLNAQETSEPVSNDSAADGEKPKSFSFDSFKGFERKKSKREIAKAKVAEEELSKAADSTPDIGNDIESIDPVPSSDSDTAETNKDFKAESNPKKKSFFGLPRRNHQSQSSEADKSESNTDSQADTSSGDKQDIDSIIESVDVTPTGDDVKDDKDKADGVEASNKKTDVKEQNTKTKKRGLRKRKDQGTGPGLPKKEKKAIKPWQIVLVLLILGIMAGIIGAFVFYEANRMDISDYQYTQKAKTQVLSSDNVVIGQLFAQNRTYVSLTAVPDDMKKAIVAIEDSRYYEHNGVDIFGIARSMVSNLTNRSATGQGASTITQQVARILFLPDISTESSFMDSLSRKCREISIALQLEEKYNKDQILEMYLNEYYFGSSAYGIQEAAKTYYGKDISQCNLAECAMLAGLPQAPSYYAPNNDYQAAKERQEYVLQRMVETGAITQQQADEAKATPITIVEWNPAVLDHQIASGYEKFVDMALEQYAKSQAPTVMKQQGLSEENAIDQIRTQVASGGYVIHTTINSTMQSHAINVSVSSYPPGSEVTDALVTVDTGGAVLAYYGGNTQVDMANTARQPGSNIKPLYYSGAIEQGLFSATSTVSDSAQTYEGGYTPQNYDNRSMGSISITNALVYSRNVPSVYVMNAMGVDNAMQWMKNMGITTIVDDDYHLATAVGGMTYGIKPVDMAAAFNCFNNAGVYNQPYFVVSVNKANGEEVVGKNGLGLDTHQAMSANTASTMWNILRQVVTRGTATAASTGYPTAGKTGTTDNAEDLWFTGMTGNLTTSIWIGTPDHAVVGGEESTINCYLYRSYIAAVGQDGLIGGLQ